MSACKYPRWEGNRLILRCDHQDWRGRCRSPAATWVLRNPSRSTEVSNVCRKHTPFYSVCLAKDLA